MEIPKLRRSNVRFESKNQDLSTLYNPKQYQKILNQLNSLKFENSEYLAFSDIAENFYLSGVDKIIKLVNYFYTKEYSHLLIFTNVQIKQEFKAIRDFVLSSFDPYQEYKINCIFIDVNQCKETLIQKLKYLQRIDNAKIAFIYTDYFGTYEQINNYYQFTKSFLSQTNDEKILNNNTFYLGKLNPTLNDFYAQLVETNLFFTTDDIHEQFVAFSDLVLFLVASQGIDIRKFVRGYCKILKRFSDKELDNNDAFKFAWFLHINHFDTVTFISNTKETDRLTKLFAYEFNTLTNELICWYDHLSFTQESSFGIQTIISGNIHNSKALINFEINYPNYNFQFTSDINSIDNLSDFDLLTLNDIQKASQKSFLNYCDSINPDIKWMNITIENTKEESCGMVIAFLYWAKIFLSLLKKQTPFN
ncbi:MULTISPECIES: hypothetical protein [unclassified Mycoplasma]|uniref:hypothetical protein n=1 Tax=unclassified Mycoplasma TaxID=2683645 RepID=UPI00211C736B|nr:MULTISPECIES: hypothetical protein [unclassified Mycoplasma]UUM19536.1 hypothetical protein NPA11_02010 [Mycoplasma sp. 1578d]UUM24456.1 hypothetical protein NPA12_01990 [Mycoplasma sp. 3686d]